MSDYKWDHAVYCHYNTSKQCSTSLSCLKGCYCSSNPHKFDGRKITAGQEKILLENGFTEEQIKDIDFKTAIKIINSIKQYTMYIK